jgi:hypothetical protein
MIFVKKNDLKLSDRKRRSGRGGSRCGARVLSGIGCRACALALIAAVGLSLPKRRH